MFPINYVNIIVDCMHSDTVLFSNGHNHAQAPKNKVDHQKQQSEAITEVFKDPLKNEKLETIVRDTYHRLEEAPIDQQ